MIDQDTASLIVTWLIACSMLALLHLHIGEAEDWSWRSLGWACLVAGIALNTWVNLAYYYDWPVLRYGVYFWIIVGLYVLGAVSVIVAIIHRLIRKRDEWSAVLRHLTVFWAILLVVWLGIRAWYGWVLS